MRTLLFFVTFLLSHYLVAEPVNEEVLTLKSAMLIIDGCQNYANKNKLSVAIAVYDKHGRLKAFSRMDGTTQAVAEVARWKGLSAAKYGVATEETKTWNVPSAPDISVSPGGVPIFSPFQSLLGGVGVSGAAPNIDVECAKAGLKAALTA